MTIDINKKIIKLIESKELTQLSDAVVLVLDNKNEINNVNNIFELIGNVLMHWSNNIWVDEDKKLIRKFFSDLDAFVEMGTAVISSNETFISGLAQFINYCISKISIDDTVDSYSMENPQCDEALLVFSSTILTKDAIKKVLQVLKGKRLYKELIKQLSIVIKHGESFASQEYALGITMRFCIYENTLKSHQYRDLIVSYLPDILTNAMKIGNFLGCKEIFNNKRFYINKINANNINVDSFLIKSFYVINTSSDSRNNGTPFLFDIDSLAKRLLAENIWLDIERRSIAADNFSCHFSDFRSVNFAETSKIMNFTVEFDPEETYPLLEKEVLNFGGYQVAEYAMMFPNDSDMKQVNELVKLKLAKTERELTLKKVKDTHQKTIEVPVTKNSNFDDDISECTDGTFDDEKNVTPLAKPTKKLVTTLKSTNKPEKLQKIQQPSRVKYGKNAIAAKTNIVTDQKMKQKDIETGNLNIRTRSNKSSDIQTSSATITLATLPAPPPPVKSARKVKTPINEPDSTADSRELKHIDHLEDEALNNKFLMQSAQKSVVMKTPLAPSVIQTVEKSAVIKTPLAPLVKSKMRLENATDMETKNHKENVKEKENKIEVKDKIERTKKNEKENKIDKVSSSMRSVSNEENDENENINPFLNANGSRQKVKRTPLSSPLSVISNRVMIDGKEPLSLAKKTEANIKTSRISLHPNVTEGIEDSQDSFMEKETKKVNASKSEKLRIQKGPTPLSIVKNDMTSLARLSTFPTEILEETMDFENEKVASNINFENVGLDDSYYIEDTYTENSYKYTESGNKEEPVNYMMEQFSQQSNLSIDKLLTDRGESQMQDDEFSEDGGDSSSSSSGGEENILSVLVTELTSLKKSKRDKKIRKALGGAIENAETQVGNFLTQWSEYRRSKFSLIEGQIQFNLEKICKGFDEMIETHGNEISRILTEDRELEDRRKIVQHDCKEFVKEIKKESNAISQEINNVQNYLTKRKYALLSELEKEDKMHQVKKPKTQHR